MHDTFTLLTNFLSLLLKKNDCVRKALRILPCGVHGRLLFVFTTIVISVLHFVVFVVVVIVGDRQRLAFWSQQLPSSASGDTDDLSVLNSPRNGQAACSLAGLATPSTVPAPAPLRPHQVFHVLKLKLFLLPNSILAKRVNVNINSRLVVEHSHLLLFLASRLILVVTCLPGLS